VFVDDIHNISRDLKIRLAFGLSVEVVWSQVILLLHNFCLALPVKSAFLFQQVALLCLGWVM